MRRATPEARTDPGQSRRARRTRPRPGFPETRLPHSLARPARRRGPAALVVRPRRGRPGPPRHRGRRRRDQGHRRVPSRCWSRPPCSPPSTSRCTTSPWSPGTASASWPRPPWPACSPPRPRRAGRRTRPGDGRRLRARADRHERRTRRRPRRGARRRSKRPACTAANRNGAGQVVAAGAAATRWRSSPPSRRPRPGSSRCRWPARSTRRTWPRPSRRSPRSPAAITAGRPDPDPAVQPRRRGRRPRPEHAPAAGPAGHRAGALGPVHGDAGRDLGVTGDHRAAAGRHARRPGQARAQGRRRPRSSPSTPRRPGRRPRR